MKYEVIDSKKELPEKEGEFFIFFKGGDEKKGRKMLAYFHPKGGGRRSPAMFCPVGLSTCYTMPLPSYVRAEIKWLKEI